MSPDDAPAPAGRNPARHAAATIALALAFTVASLLTGLVGPGSLHPADGLPVPVADDVVPVLAVEAAGGLEAGDVGDDDDAARHRTVRGMWLAVLPAVVLAVAAVRVAWHRRVDAPRSGRAHPGRTRAVRPPPVRLLA